MCSWAGVPPPKKKEAMQGGSYQQWDDSLQATLMECVTVPALDSVVRPGMASFEQLNEADTFRFNFWMGSVMRRYDSCGFSISVRSEIVGLFPFPSLVDRRNEIFNDSEADRF
jgi:hypothetical protein